MGQGYSINALSAGPSAIEATELSDLTFEKALGSARLLRTVRARHQNGIVVVKVCQKTTPGESFQRYARALKEERRALRNIPNVLPYQRIRETPTLGILVRQFIHSSLYDRVSIRPFLENIEKKWIAFQLLSAVRDCHSRGIFHGDIKSENVLVTSWIWVYLTDFASTFKPVYLPEDNPHEFTIYYDTSARRTCYLAPERFYRQGEKPEEPYAVQWSMDMFSVGCVIAELFTETPTFTLSQLFKYRRGEYDPTIPLLHKIDDEHVRALISSMIRLDPEERWHAQDYLDEYKGKAFPLYFYQHLHTLMQEITEPSPVRKPQTDAAVNNGEADDRIDRIYNDFDTLSISLGYSSLGNETLESQSDGDSDLFPMKIDMPNNLHTANANLSQNSDDGTFILLNVITTSMRSTARGASRIRACELFLAFAERLPDEAKLDRILPYLMPLLAEDSSDMVLMAALRTMTQLLALVNVASAVNSFLFTQYIFPRLQTFVHSKAFKQNPIVRATYATCLASLAQTASRFLDLMQAIRTDGSISIPGKPMEETNFNNVDYEAYDVIRADVLQQFEAQTKLFLTDNDTSVRRAFLTSVTTLCVFFGEARASDVILSHLNTYLNDPDWQLKCAFLKTIVGVSVFVGSASLEELILPLMLQALSDPQEFVIEQVLRSLASMAEMGLLQRAKTWEVIDVTAPFQLHPNLWIKEAASHFVAAATTYLSLADIRIIVTPIIQPYLKVPVSSCSESDLLDALKKPLPRAVLDLAIQWAQEVDKSSFWKHAVDARATSQSMIRSTFRTSSIATGHKSLAKLPQTQEDEQRIGRLRNAGMRAEDEAKILALREFLWRSAQRIKRDEPVLPDPIYEQIISLSKLNIMPQTVIFDNDTTAYTEHMKDLNSALEEATVESETGVSDGNGAIGTVRGENGTLNYDSKSPTLTLPVLRRQASISARSLSSSPGSGIGLLGKDNERHRSFAGSLRLGDELRTKAIAAVATDDVTAAGKIHTPIARSRATSQERKGDNQRKASSAAVRRRAPHNYTGTDPAVLKLLDAVYVNEFPLSAGDFGPMVQPLKRGLIQSVSSSSAPVIWRPQGTLIGLLGEHSDRVNRIAVSPDQSFIATASDDGTVKIWDALRFERNVTHKARATYNFGTGVRVTDACFIDATHTLIITGSDGGVRIVKIESSDNQSGTSFRIGRTVRNWHIPSHNPHRVEFAVCCQYLRGDGMNSTSKLLVVTNLARILSIDLRDMSIIADLQNPVQHGIPTSFCLGRHHDWLLVGTANGVLDLWDFRFLVRLRSWGFQSAIPITRLQLHPNRKNAKRNRVCISGGTAYGEVSVWDIEKLICHEVYRPQTHSTQSSNVRAYELRTFDDERSENLLDRVAGAAAAGSESLTADRVATVVGYCGISQESEDAEQQHPFVITGGPDHRVRFWDCERLEGCRVISGRSIDEPLPTYTFSSLGLDARILTEKAPGADQDTSGIIESNSVRSKRSMKRAESSNAKPSRYDAIRLAAQNLIEGHLDTITDVALLERPFGIILSADRSGQILAYQ